VQENTPKGKLGASHRKKSGGGLKRKNCLKELILQCREKKGGTGSPRGAILTKKAKGAKKKKRGKSKGKSFILFPRVDDKASRLDGRREKKEKIPRGKEAAHTYLRLRRNRKKGAFG